MNILDKIIYINLFTVLVFFSSVSEAADTYPRGTLAGNCVMQTDASFKVSHNGAVDSTGKVIPTVPAGVGGATWPIVNCPNSGNHMNTRCDSGSGWKPVMQNVVQMSCGTNCVTYWITYQCAKL